MLIESSILSILSRGTDKNTCHQLFKEGYIYEYNIEPKNEDEIVHGIEIYYYIADADDRIKEVILDGSQKPSILEQLFGNLEYGSHANGIYITLNDGSIEDLKKVILGLIYSRILKVFMVSNFTEMI